MRQKNSRIGLVVIAATILLYPATFFGQTTTYASLTAANTSAGIVAPNNISENVSKSSLKSLLPAGSQARIYARLLTWYGTSGHTNVGYSSTDGAQVQKQVQDMISRGIDGAIVNWQGQRDSTDQSAMVVMTEAAQHNGTFEFAIEEDAKALGSCASDKSCDLSGRIVSDLTYIVNTYVGTKAYMKYRNNPVIFLYGMEAYQVNWDKIRSSIPGNPVLMFRTAS
jgi:hypothetical protein